MFLSVLALQEIMLSSCCVVLIGLSCNTNNSGATVPFGDLNKGKLMFLTSLPGQYLHKNRVS